MSRIVHRLWDGDDDMDCGVFLLVMTGAILSLIDVVVGAVWSVMT